MQCSRAFAKILTTQKRLHQSRGASYQGGERHEVFRGLWRFWRQEGVAGVRRRREGSGFAGVRPVAAQEEALAPGAHTHQGFRRLQVRVLQTRGPTGGRLLAVVPSSLCVGPTMIHRLGLGETKALCSTARVARLNFDTDLVIA